MESIITQQIKMIDEINPKFKKKLGLNQKEVAETLGCSSSTLEARRREGTGIEWIQMGGRIIYPKIKIAEYLANTIKTA
jgi:DNA-binding XRE family transcriptional regulator